MSSITADVTITKCRQTFATHGLPVIVVTDNGPTFISDQFTQFMKSNGVKLRHTSAYHPSSNGLAENAVKSVKSALRKMCAKKGVLQDQIACYLFKHRLTPHTTTGRSPAELLLGRLPRSRLSLIRPNIVDDVLIKQNAQKEQYDKSVRPRSFSVDDPVLVRNMVPTGSNSQKWFLGTVQRIITPLTYEILLANGRIVKRHIDHLRPKTDTTDVELQANPVQDDSDVSVPVPAIRKSNRTTKGNAPLKLNI